MLRTLGPKGLVSVKEPEPLHTPSEPRQYGSTTLPTEPHLVSMAIGCELLCMKKNLLPSGFFFVLQSIMLFQNDSDASLCHQYEVCLKWSTTKVEQVKDG